MAIFPMLLALGLAFGTSSEFAKARGDILLLGAITNAPSTPPPPPPIYETNVSVLTNSQSYSTNSSGLLTNSTAYTNAQSYATNSAGAGAAPNYGTNVSGFESSPTSPPPQPGYSGNSSSPATYSGAPLGGPIIVTAGRPSIFGAPAPADIVTIPPTTSSSALDNAAILPVPMILMPPAPPIPGTIVGAPPPPLPNPGFLLPPAAATTPTVPPAPFFPGTPPGLGSGSSIAGPPPAPPPPFTTAPGSRF
jgi:hypothetical protein